MSNLEPIATDDTGHTIYERDDGHYMVTKKASVDECFQCGTDIPRGFVMCGDCAADQGFPRRTR